MSRQLSNTVWNYSSGLAGIASNLLLFPVGVAIAGSTAIAPWLLAWSLIQIANFTDFGLGVIGIRRLREKIAQGGSLASLRRESSKTHLLFAIVAIIVTTIFAFVCMASIGTENPELLAACVVIGSACVLATCLARSANVVLWAHDRPDIERKAVLLALAAKIGLLSAASVSPAPLVMVMWSDAALLIIPSILCIYAALRVLPLTRFVLRDFADFVREAGSSSLVVFTGGFAYTCALQSPVIIASAVFGPSDVVAASALVRLLQMVRTAVMWFVNPFIVPLTSDVDSDSRHRSASKLLSLALSMGVIGAAVIAVSGGSLASVWVHGVSGVSALSFSFSAPVIFAIAVVSAGSLIVNMTGNPRMLAVSLFVGSVVSLALSFGGAFFEGFSGSILGLSVGLMVTSIVVFRLSEPKGRELRRSRRRAFLSAILGSCVIVVAGLAGLIWVSALGQLLVVAVSAAVIMSYMLWSVIKS